MSLRYKGGVISSVAPTTSGTSYTGVATGVWSMEDQIQAKAAGLWPKGVGVPDSPTSIAATTGNTQASVAFTAPVDNGGSAITGYTATSSPGSISASNASSPVVVTGLTNGTAYTFTVVATNDRGNSAPSAVSNAVTPVAIAYNLWSWGRNSDGQLGLGNRTYYSSPKQVGSLTDWKSIYRCRPSFSVKLDGTLWSWGYGGVGSLGLGNITNYSSPKQVGALTNWSSVLGSGTNTLAIKTDGTLWAWGQNDQGQLGLGNRTYYSSPKQVGALTNWSNFGTNSVSSLMGMAIKTDGTLWSWGYGATGSLGLGNRTNYSSPKQVGALTDWLSISPGYDATLAIKTGGTLWSWGGNSFGHLGLGNTTSYSSPKQIGALTNWSFVSAATYTGGAIKSTGALWVWGRNQAGQIGVGNQNNYSSPKQVGSLTNWLKGSIGYSCQIIKTDGTLWSWGGANFGQLGHNNRNSYSSPKQIGALTTWLSVAGGAYNVLATKDV